MSTTLLQFDFPFHGPWGGELARSMEGLASEIAAEEGLVWKIWTENPERQRAGGIYLFRDPNSAEAYRRKHEARLAAFGIAGIAAQAFAVNAPLSAATRAPL